jgi:predicted nucleic acid-binding protein
LRPPAAKRAAAAIGAHDLVIAATGVMPGYRIATRDHRRFPRIRGLDIVYW